MLQTQEVGYIPAENVEGPFERLARLNRHRNVAVTLATEADTVQVERKVHKSYLVKMRATSELHPASGKFSALSKRCDGQKQDASKAKAEGLHEERPLVFFGPSTVREFSDLEEWSDSSDASQYELDAGASDPYGSDDIQGPIDGQDLWHEESQVKAPDISGTPSGAGYPTTAVPMLGLHSQACQSQPELLSDSQGSPRFSSQDDYFAAHEAYYAAQLDTEGDAFAVWSQNTPMEKKDFQSKPPPLSLSTRGASHPSSVSANALQKDMNLPSLGSPLDSLSGDECAIRLPLAPSAVSSPTAVPSTQLIEPPETDANSSPLSVSNARLPSPPRTAPRLRPGSLQVPPGTDAGISLHVIRVFAQAELNTSVAYKTVLLTESTTAREIVRQAVQRFGIVSVRPAQVDCSVQEEEYALNVHALNGKERTLDPDECPLKIYESLTEKQAPSIRWSSLDLPGTGQHTSFDSKQGKLVERIRRTSRDFSDDHSVKFFLATAPEDHGTQTVDTSGETISLPKPHVPSPFPTSPAILHFGVRVILFADELAPSLSLDASGVVASHSQVTSHPVNDSAWTYAQADLSLPRSTSVAELVEMTVEYFGIPNGVSQGGEEASKPQLLTQTAGEQGTVTYGLTVNVDSTAEKALRPSSYVYDAFPSSPPLLALSPASSTDQPELAEDKSREQRETNSFVSEPQLPSTVFLLRRMDTIRHLSSALSITVSPSARARSPTEHLLATKREAKRRSQLASFHDPGSTVCPSSDTSHPSAEAELDRQDAAGMLHGSPDPPIRTKIKLQSAPPKLTKDMPEQALPSKAKTRPAREVSAALALKSNALPVSRTDFMNFEPLQLPSNHPLSPVTESGHSYLSVYGEGSDQLNKQQEMSDDTMEEVEDDMISPYSLLAKYSPLEQDHNHDCDRDCEHDRDHERSIQSVDGGWREDTDSSSQRLSLLEQLFTPSPRPVGTTSSSQLQLPLPSPNQVQLSVGSTGTHASITAPGSPVDRSSGSTDTAMTASELSGSDFSGTLSAALVAFPTVGEEAESAAGSGPAPLEGTAEVPRRTESLRRAYVVRVNQSSSIASSVSFSRGENGASFGPGTTATAGAGTFIGITNRARPRAVSTSSATVMPPPRPSSPGPSPTSHSNHSLSPSTRPSARVGQLPRSQSLNFNNRSDWSQRPHSAEDAVADSSSGANPEGTADRRADHGTRFTSPATSKLSTSATDGVTTPAVSSGLELAPPGLDLLFSITDDAYFASMSCSRQPDMAPGSRASRSSRLSSSMAGTSAMMLAHADSQEICDHMFFPTQFLSRAHPQILRLHNSNHPSRHRELSSPPSAALGRYARVDSRLSHVAHSLDRLLADALRLPA